MTVRHVPEVTDDLDRARADLDEYGYALVADALSEGQIEAMLDRLFQQVAGEAAAEGRSSPVDDPHGMGAVLSLLNKGRIWQDLLDVSSPVHAVVDHAFRSSFDGQLSGLLDLQQRFVLSSLGANFKRKEVDYPPLFHTDQAFAPGHLGYPLVLNVFWFLTEFTRGNGATLAVPGSHKLPPARWGEYSGEGAVTIEAPAGTAFVFEGRTWHAAGINTDGQLRAMANSFFCAPYIRQREVLAMNLRQDVVDQLSDDQRKLCGFDTMYQGPAGAHVGFGLIEPTFGRTNVSHRLPGYGELSG